MLIVCFFVCFFSLFVVVVFFFVGGVFVVSVDGVIFRGDLFFMFLPAKPVLVLVGDLSARPPVDRLGGALFVSLRAGHRDVCYF